MIKPRTKAPKGQQLTEKLTGELAVYEQVGLPQHALGKRTAYRYRGVLLLYQQALNGREPRSLGHDWYVNLFPSVRPKAILHQVSHPQIGVAN